MDALRCRRQSFHQVSYRNRPPIVNVINANKCQKIPPLFRNGEENEKVIGNPHADLDHH